jgi:hypothetical protein
MAQFLTWGNAHDGSPAVTGTINTYATCTGTSGQSSLTTALSAGLGDMILIHQTYGTGAGQWELNHVLADAGATLTLGLPLAYTYGTGAQAVLVPQYTGGTLSGTVTATAWNGSVGGITALVCSGDLTISGTVGASSAGSRGGTGDTAGNTFSYCGDSYAKNMAKQQEANGTGGGGGYNGGGGGGEGAGGGGGHSTAGNDGYGLANRRGLAGSTIGVGELTSAFFGGGGGAGGGGTAGAGKAGGAGGGFVLVVSRGVTISGTVTANGANGTNGTKVGIDYLESGGGGAGGSVLVKSQIAVLGTSKITVNAGAGGTGVDNHNGGAGGVGRIRCDYYNSVSGSTNPTLSSAQDTNLKSPIYGGML